MNKWANELNRTFSNEDVQIVKKKHLKKCSPSLVVKEMQINTTLRFHLTLVRIATIKNTNNNKCWQENGEKGTLIHFYDSTTTMQNSMESSLKTKSRSDV
jgi:hypothetical protein